VSKAGAVERKKKTVQPLNEKGCHIVPLRRKERGLRGRKGHKKILIAEATEGEGVAFAQSKRETGDRASACQGCKERVSKTKKKGKEKGEGRDIELLQKMRPGKGGTECRKRTRGQWLLGKHRGGGGARKRGKLDKEGAGVPVHGRNSGGKSWMTSASTRGKGLRRTRGDDQDVGKAEEKELLTKTYEKVTTVGEVSHHHRAKGGEEERKNPR